MGSVNRRGAEKLGGLRGKAGESEPTNKRNIVLTGPGRSGTTLTCHLLNKLSDTVALAEPLSPTRFEEQMPDYDAVCDELERVFRRIRRRALREGVVRTKHVGGVVPDNTKGHVDGVRQRIAVKGDIPVGKDLSKRFHLAIKQPGMFTALLPVLTRRFPCYAIVRNPLAIMASVGSIQPTEKKKPPARMRYDAAYRSRVREGHQQGTDQMDQRLRLMHYNFERYEESLPRKNIIRYEDICATGGKALQIIVSAAADLDETLENKNTNPIYNRDRILSIGERLLRSRGAYWNFYSKRDVEEIMEAYG